MTIRKSLNLASASLALTAGFFASCRTSQPVIEVPQVPQRSIVVLYDNDVHCGIDGYKYLAGLRDAISDTAYVAVTTSGDYLQGGTAGAISHGQYIVDIMKHVGYDALALGNHEFDYYVPRMFELLHQVDAPVTCVNFRDMEGHRIFKQYVMKQMGDKKVAFIGVVTPTTVYTEAYSFFDANDKQIYTLSEKETYRLVQEAANAAREAGADYVIVLSHLGEDKNAINVDSHGLIASTRGIDVVLDGHTHSVIPSEVVLNADGKPVHITQTGTKFENFGKLVISPDGKISTELIANKDLIFENAEVRHATDSINALAQQLVSRPICQSDVDITILDAKGKQLVRTEETNSGDLVADAYRIITGADFAITNGGGIRSEVKAGRLTYGDIVSLLPYDNYVCVVEVTGAQLKELLRACTQFTPVENGDFPQVSGLNFTVNVGQTEQISDLKVLNSKTGEYEPIDLERTYQLATIDYCITGGGLQGLLKKNNIIKPSIIIYNECLIQYVTQHLNSHIGAEYAHPQGRIKINY